MTPEDINHALREQDIRQIDITRRLGMPLTSRTIVSLVIHRMSRSRRIEEEIASALKRPIYEVFPDWYEASGKTAKRRRTA